MVRRAYHAESLLRPSVLSQWKDPRRHAIERPWLDRKVGLDSAGAPRAARGIDVYTYAQRG